MSVCAKLFTILFWIPGFIHIPHFWCQISTAAEAVCIRFGPGATSMQCAGQLQPAQD